jgi:RNA polymerase sigma factor (sigma-70 family)
MDVPPGLMADFNNMDGRAWNEVYNKCYKHINWFIYNLTQNQQEAQDIAQECFIRIYTKELRFDTPEKLKAFLFITAKNMGINYLRSRKTIQAANEELPYLQAGEEEWNMIIEASIRMADMDDELLLAINELPERSREVITRHYFKKQSGAEIAALLDVTVQTVHNRLHEARKMLFNVLKDSRLKDLILLPVMLKTMLYFIF